MQRTHIERRRSEAEQLTMSLNSLVAALASADPATRHNARENLVKFGEGAVSVLVDALRDRDDQVRWGAAKAAWLASSRIG